MGIKKGYIRRRLLQGIPKGKDPMGYTYQEILDLIKPMGIHHATFFKALGVTTGTISEMGQLLTYTCDIERALRMIVEGRKMYGWEFD